LRGRGELAVFAITTVAVLAATAILARLGFATLWSVLCIGGMKSQGKEK
jgi:hypothetical protein